MTFSPDERERYARHILLKEIGGAGQQRLKAATVAIVGMGGLGAPAALYLAAAGVGVLRLIDSDVVALSNLQRQVLYRSDEVGAPKVNRAEEALTALNPHVAIDARCTRLSADNARALLDGAAIVLDGTDDFATRFAVNQACHDLGVTLISGAVGRWEGQVATFKSGATKHLPSEQRLPCYRCFVPEAPPNAETCAQVGIVGALTGVIGSLMALEAIKEIAEAGESLAGRLLLFDGLRGESRTVRLPRDPACSVCGG
ncbi:MAG TPA: molybdopterin-synthase adenylyltransferase MoeB [Caulobacterales bacterium]|nr:molybdopterin-synthase adenylyltransferase MoeB [Caulobacterales bacterium]